MTIKERSTRMSGERLPHEGVYVRLAVSGVDGIGVFAILPIPKGTNIFKNDHAEMVWIDAEDVESTALPDGVKKLYRDFAVARSGRLGVPRNFNMLTTGWYLNEPPEGVSSNVSVDPKLNFIALRDIQPGEELLTDYSDFSAPPDER